MHTAVRFLAFGLQLSLCRALNCSPPFKNILGVCLHVNVTGQSYCDAQAYCASIGGELVRSSTYLAINGKTFSGMPFDYWVGLTDLLHERKSSRAGWLWSDGSADPPSSSFSWLSPEPGTPLGGLQDCTGGCKSLGKLCDFYCAAEKAPVCQPRLLPTLPAPDADFKEVAIPTGLSNVEFAEMGCTQLMSDVDFTECSVLCVIEPRQWCVSFYYNEVKKECHLLLYTDSTINMGDAEGWKKFVRN